MDNNPKVKFSAGADETSLAAALQELLSSPGKGGRWTLIPNGQGLERSFKFRNFTKTWVSESMRLGTHVSSRQSFFFDFFLDAYAYT